MQRRRLSIASILIASFLAAITVGPIRGCYIAMYPQAISTKAAKPITRGMHAKDIKQRLGEPHWTDSGNPDSRRWVYRLEGHRNALLIIYLTPTAEADFVFRSAGSSWPSAVQMDAGAVPLLQALIGLVLLVPLAAITYWFLCVRVREKECKGPIPLLHGPRDARPGRRLIRRV